MPSSTRELTDVEMSAELQSSGAAAVKLLGSADPTMMCGDACLIKVLSNPSMQQHIMDLRPKYLFAISGCVDPRAVIIDGDKKEGFLPLAINVNHVSHMVWVDPITTGRNSVAVEPTGTARPNRSIGQAAPTATVATAVAKPKMNHNFSKTRILTELSNSTSIASFTSKQIV